MSDYSQTVKGVKTHLVEIRFGWRGGNSVSAWFDRIPAKGEKIKLRAGTYTVKKVVWSDSFGSGRFVSTIHCR